MPVNQRTFKPKICLECGKEFIPRNGQQKYCDGPHTTKCKVCGKDITYTCSPREKPTCCSQSCVNESHRRTVFNRYGVDNVSQLQSVKDKISQANKSSSVKAKREATCLSRYGVTNPSKSESIKLKLSDIMKSEEYLQRRANTCLERYGNESPMQNKAVIQRRLESCVERYGSTAPPRSREYYAKLMIDPSKVDNYLAFKGDPKKYIQSNYIDLPNVRTLMEDLGVTETPIYEILVANNCRDLIQHSYSNIEESVYHFLTSLPILGEIRRNDRTIIKPYELDFYLPDYKIGIECNPASTHNSSIDCWGEVKSPTYHKMKSDLCNQSGVFLFHIFGYEWWTKQSIVKSMLTNLLKVNTYKYGGRDTYICEVDYTESKLFLDTNHRQGFTTSKVRLGLRLKSDNSLVSLMTFSKPRHTIGKTLNYSDNTWELSRFCNRLNTSVYGGASKLFNYFVCNYDPDIVISFSDIAHTKGGLYDTLGFKLDHTTAPNYFWTDIYDSKYLNRVSCQKSKLKQLFSDETIDLHDTENNIMINHGYVKVYDSGVHCWIKHIR